MDSHCSFCGRSETVLRAGRLALCEPCSGALCAVKAGDSRYDWFEGAVRRALFDAPAPRRSDRLLNVRRNIALLTKS